MRNADEEEETRVRAALGSTAGEGGCTTPASRQPGLPPPLVDSADNETTHLMNATGLGGKNTWLVSDGPSEPQEFTEQELVAALEERRVTERAFAWQRGMNQWLSVTQIHEFLALDSGSSRTSASDSKLAPPKRPKLHGQSPTGEASGQRNPERKAENRVSTSLQEHLPSIVVSSTVSTADFSQVNKAAAARAGATPAAPAGTPATDTAQLDDADSAPDLEKTLEKPRPAAGRPPSPSEPVAIGKRFGPKVNSPTQTVLATGRAQASIAPKIAHSELTLPARNRLPLEQLSGRKPNMLLWLLGAGGWVVAGVLAGILLAKEEARAPTAVDSSTGVSIAQSGGPAPTLRVLAPNRDDTDIDSEEPEAENTLAVSDTQNVVLPRPAATASLPHSEPAPNAPKHAPKQAPSLNTAVQQRTAASDANASPQAPAGAAVQSAVPPEIAEDVLTSPGF